MTIKLNHKIEKQWITLFADEFKDNTGQTVKLGLKIRITEEIVSLHLIDLLTAWIKQTALHLGKEVEKRTDEEFIALTEDKISSIAYEALYPPSVRLEDITELCRLLQCQQEDYNQRNFGDANGWDRHIRKAQDDFSDKYNESPWDFLSSFVKKYSEES